MSNILIIKHGSLGDIAQASGAIQDIFENHPNYKIYLLTTKPYFEIFKKNPNIHEVILDKRLSRFNVFYLFSLMKDLKKHNFFKVFDLQNSSRSTFYKKILFPNANSEKWSSSLTTLPEGKTKEEFDKKSVLERFDHQLKTSNLKINNTLKPDFNWASDDIGEIINKYDLKKYILLFPFCSPHLTIKKWPYYEKLTNLILENFGDEYKIITAPGPNEIKDSLNLKATPVLNNDKALSISQLTTLIQKSSFVIANDTGPAHIAAHTNTEGIGLYGKHITAYKVSIERKNFKAIQVEDLNNLSAEKVFERMSNFLS